MRAAPLVEHLHALQERCGGAIPVEDYVREALYHSEFGYYSRNIRTVGWRGDFATSATLGESLGRALARWIAANRIRSEQTAKCHVIEVGAGTGDLAATILRRIGWWVRRDLAYHIVESSPVLQEEQRQKLAGATVEWHSDMSGALDSTGGMALIFSNELIDAFPPRQYELRDGYWHEVAIRIDGTSVSEVLISRIPIASSGFTMGSVASSASDYDALAGRCFKDGQRIEVHASVVEWLLTWSASWKAGSMLTIDYGDTADRLYVRRQRGTLRGYFHHQRCEGLAVYHRFGRQDITCDVNFTDLECWGRHLGWMTHSLCDQTQFLAEYGTRQRNMPFHDAALSEISGAGSAFKVLIQKMPQGGAPAGSLSGAPSGSLSWKLK